MSLELDALWRIRTLDDELRTLRERKARLPGRRAEIEAGLKRARSDQAIAEERGKAAALAKRNAEKEAETLVEQERKFQGQLGLVKKNEEYAALLHEIEGVKRKRSELETFVLERMDEEEAVAQDLARARQALAAADSRAGEERRTIEVEESELRAREEGLEGERAGLLSELPTTLRSRYERIHQAKKGMAVVELVRDSCGGCGATMPLQAAIEIRKRQSVQLCPDCGRILVHPVGEASAEASP